MKSGWVLGTLAVLAIPLHADVIYNNLTPTNSIAVATRQGAVGVTEIEAADDFVISGSTSVTGASFTGLFYSPTGASPFISGITVDIFRVYPLDSDTSRTLTVPTRVNSPSDTPVQSRTGAQLGFISSVLNSSLSALNSVLPGGIHPQPNQTTGGNGAVRGQEVQIDVTFLTPFVLTADHYFFVPEVTLSDGATFLWLSASRPISGAGTTPFSPDLQALIRDGNLAPDWLRIGTDIVGGATPPTYNLAFSLQGVAVPEPGSLALMGSGLLLLAGRALLRRKN